MTQSLLSLQILIIEPNIELKRPYQFLPPQQAVTQVSTFTEAEQKLASQHFDLIFLSTSFSARKQLSLLDDIKSSFQKEVTPLIFVTDFKKTFSIIPGLTCAHRVGLVSSMTSKQELFATLQRLFPKRQLA